MNNTITVGPATLDLRLYAGDGFRLMFAFVDKSTNEPFDTAGTWAAEVRAPADAPDPPMLSFTVEQYPGAVTISLTGDEVRTLVGETDTMWDLQQTPPGEEPRTWYRGSIVAVQDVTRV